MHFSDLLLMVALYALVRSADIAISALKSTPTRDVGRAVIYGIVAILLAFAIALTLTGIHL